MAMAFLSRQSGNGLIQAKQVAGHLGIPTDSALKILQALSRQGLIQSQLGRTGGYRLQRDPQEVTLLEIVESIDGPIQAQMPLQNVQDEFAGSIDALQLVFEQITSGIRSELSRATVETLTRRESYSVLSPTA